MLHKLIRGEAFWTLTDQAAVSGGNFLTSLLLARSLGRAEFGTYSLLFLALISLNTLHFSLVLYPMTLFVAKEETGDEVTSAIAQTLLFSLPWGLLLLCVCYQLGRMNALPGMFLAMVAWQLQEVARRALIAAGKVRLAILPDLLSYAGQAAALYLLKLHSMSAIFFCIATTSFLALAWQLALVRPSFGTGRPTLNLGRSWELGKFSLIANFLSMGLLQFPSWTLDFFSGRAAVASYQSLATLIGIANPVILSMSNMLIPGIARASRDGIHAARRMMNRNGLLFAALLSPAFVALGIFPQTVMRLAYGSNSGYVSLAPLLRVLAVTLVLQFLATLIGAYEGGVARPQTYMYAQIVGLGVLVTSETYLIYRYGIQGAVFSSLAVAIVRVLFFAIKSSQNDRASALEEA